jgi:hypothetical protein
MQTQLVALFLVSCVTATGSDLPAHAESIPKPSESDFPIGDWLQCENPKCLLVSRGYQFRTDGTWFLIGPEYGVRAPDAKYCIAPPGEPRVSRLQAWQRTASDRVKFGKQELVRVADRIAKTSSNYGDFYYLRMNQGLSIPTCTAMNEPCSEAGECKSGECENGRCHWDPLMEAPGF